MNLGVKAVKSIKINDKEVRDTAGIYENHRVKLWKARESLKVGSVNIIEIEYYQLYNNNRVGLHNFQDQRTQVQVSFSFL